MEVRYEELVSEPRHALNRLGDFLQHDLDYDRIQANRVGSVKKPLTSFREDLNHGHFMPVGRWKKKFPPKQLVAFEALVGDYLRELGYALSTTGQRSSRFSAKSMRLVYGLYHPFKQWAKVNTPLSRLMVNYSAILIDK
jgi:hypothetical protein